MRCTSSLLSFPNILNLDLQIFFWFSFVLFDFKTSPLPQLPRRGSQSTERNTVCKLKVKTKSWGVGGRKRCGNRELGGADKEVRIHAAKSSALNERGNVALIVLAPHNCYD